MTFDLTKIMQSKREFRQRLAAKPIEEKLAMLDALRARAIALRGPRAERQPGAPFAKNLQLIGRTQSRREMGETMLRFDHLIQGAGVAIGQTIIQNPQTLLI